MIPRMVCITILQIISLLILVKGQGPIFNRGSFTCAATSQPSVGFCMNPPASPVDFNILSGVWYVTHVTGSSNLVSNRPCSTIEYTFNPSGTITIKKCSGIGPECSYGELSQRPGQNEPGKLITNFDGKAYTIAAVLSTVELGYVGVVVYRCEVGSKGPRAAYTVLSKSPQFSNGILYLMRQQLACRGYDINVRFVPVLQTPSRCQYSFNAPMENPPNVDVDAVIPL